MRIWAALAALVAGGPIWAETTPEVSLRPNARPTLLQISPSETRSVDALAQAVNSVLSATASTGGSQAAASQLALRHSLRPRARAGETPRTSKPPATPRASAAASDEGIEMAFQDWVRGFRSRALSQGIRSTTFTEAFTGISLDAEVIELDGNQAEFSTPIWTYLDRAVSDDRISRGKAALQEHHATLNRIEQRYGVDKEVVLAIWGMETNFGSFRGGKDVIRSLATLAYEGRRAAFFEAQLIAALRILDAGDVAPRQMVGSWAGAMGHTQFMPTSYLDHAVDFTGDGKRDIWSDDPSDALASTAAYLKRFGWISGQPWGVEVQLPAGFDYRLADRKIQKSPSEWAAIGVRDMTGHEVANFGPGALLLPVGSEGAAFMVFRNFKVIERYNAADAYVIGVGHLGDRLMGGAPIQSGWPEKDRVLSRSERKELQQRLTKAGFDTGGVDGLIGPGTRKAVRAYQIATGLVPDGYAAFNLLTHLR